MMKSQKVKIKRILIILGIIFSLNFLIGSNFNRVRWKSNLFIENDTNLKLSLSNQYQLDWYGLWDDTGFQWGMGLVVDSFKNIYQSGYTNFGPNGLNDGIIFKTDASGNQLWNQTWGTSNNDIGWDIAIDSNNYIYVVGSIDNGGQIILLKFDNSGSQIWNRTWNDLSNANGKSIAVDSEDNLYVLGDATGSAKDIVIIKYNSSGSKIWQDVWGGAQDDGTYANQRSDLVLDSQNNLYVASSTWSYGATGGDALIMKYNSSGSRIWNKTFGGANYDVATGISVDKDNNIYIGGETTSFGPGAYGSAFVAKFDNLGNYLWNRSWAGPDNLMGRGFDLTSDPLGNVYLTGYINIPGFDNELTFLLKYNNSGSLMLNKTWGTGIDICEGYGIHVDSLYNIYISGFVNQYDGKSGVAFLLKYKELTKPAPSITINSPSSNDYLGNEAPLFNITVKHRYPLNSTWYTIDGGWTNYSVDGTILVETLGDYYYTNIIGKVDQDTWNSVSNDITMRFYTNDTYGKEEYAEVTVNKELFEYYTTWGGASGDEYSNLIINDSFGNIYVGGNTASFGEGIRDLVLIKYDSSGTQLWNRTWGGVYDDTIYGIELDPLGNIYISGLTTANPGTDIDMVLVKYNSFGTQLWNRTFGGGLDDRGYEMAIDSTGNVYQGGWGLSYGPGGADMYLVKYSSSGTQQWNRTWGGGATEYCNNLEVDSLDNIYITGITYSFGAGGDIFLVKYNSSGVQQWNRTWGGSGADGSSMITTDSSNNIYVSGTTQSFGAVGIDMILIKYNSSGAKLWNSTWGGSNDDTVHGFAIDASGNIYTTGETWSFSANSDIFLNKFNSSGVLQWNAICGAGGVRDRGLGVVISSSESVYVAGHVGGTGNYDMALVQYDGSGVQQWNHTWGGSLIDSYEALTLDLDGNIYLTGYTASFGAGNNDIILVKYDTAIPKISITSPGDNEFIGSVAPSFNISIIESNLDTNWYTLDGGITNITFSGLTGTINQTEWDKKGDGPVTIRFYANDTSGKEGYEEVIVYKDTITPTSSILFTPHSDTNYVNISTVFTLNTNDGGGSGVSLIRYKINNSAWIDYVSPFNLSGFAYGDYLITYQATDLVGNVELENVALITLVAYDSIIIQIISPGTNDYFGINPPAFEISIIGTNIDTVWYTLDGILNVTFTGLTGTIDSFEWGKFSNGGVNIRFYANNTYGIFGYAEVNVLKDIIAPTSAISFTPYDSTNIVVGSTLFTLTGSDGAGSGLSMIYYRINDSSYTEYVVPFNFSIYAAGDYLISYYAIDLVGNIESENTVLVTLIEIESPSGSPGIPGYELISLITVSLFVMAIIINKKFKKLNSVKHL